MSELVEVSPSQAMNSWLKYFEDLQPAEPDNLMNIVNNAFAGDTIEEEPESEVNNVIGFGSISNMLER